MGTTIGYAPQSAAPPCISSMSSWVFPRPQMRRGMCGDVPTQTAGIMKPDCPESALSSFIRLVLNHSPSGEALV